MSFIFDLHCDLLIYLAGDAYRTPYDEQVRCSIPDLRAGQVKLQTMALFAETGPGSSDKGLAQAEIFKVLPNTFPEAFEIVQAPSLLPHLLTGERIGVVAAIENASAIVEEMEPIQEGLDRFLLVFGKIGRPLYIGLTWNDENRFGGGAKTQVGLKEDGKRLLDFMHRKEIAVDFSHASDALVHDILNYIDQQRLDVPVMASHSDARAVTNNPRNLPDELIKQIVTRHGLIGLNLVRAFLGNTTSDQLAEHVHHFLDLGCDKTLAFGADFFYEGDIKPGGLGHTPEGWYFSDAANSGCYGRLLHMLKEKLSLSDDQVHNLANGNVTHYLQRVWKEPKLTPEDIYEEAIDEG